MDAVKDIASAILHDINHLFHAFRNMGYGINTSGAVLILVLIALGTIGFYANLKNTSDTLKNKINVSIGSGLGAVQNPDAPPLPPPTEIVSLRIYPIKSCRGIELTSTRLRRMGLTLDRNWMFVDKATRKFMTIRSDSSMTLIDTKIVQADDNSDAAVTKFRNATGQQDQTMLEVSIHGTDAAIAIPAFPSRSWLEQNTTLSTVEIWEQETDGWEYSADINRIFSKFFNKDVALIYKGPTPRNVAVNGRVELYGRETPHHFADVMSLQVASEASIKDLNRRLGHDPASPDALTIERFRPNIIIRGRDDHPWEEDTWKRIRIATTIPAQAALYKIDLDVVARCARCQVPNVNPNTAEKHPKQPWDTLMKFRRVDTGGAAKYKPCFGMLCIPKNEGVVAVGATVECLETTDKHLYNTRGFADL